MNTSCPRSCITDPYHLFALADTTHVQPEQGLRLRGLLAPSSSCCFVCPCTVLGSDAAKGFSSYDLSLSKRRQVPGHCIEQGKSASRRVLILGALRCFVEGVRPWKYHFFGSEGASGWPQRFGEDAVMMFCSDLGFLLGFLGVTLEGM